MGIKNSKVKYKKLGKPAKKKLNTKTSKLKSWFWAIIIAFIIMLLLRAFVFQVYVVTDTHMMAGLFPGDYILVNKLSVGARLPITPLAVPFSPMRAEGDAKIYHSNLIILPYYRLQATEAIKRGDILVFNSPTDDSIAIDKRIVYAKRFVALPTDTIKIRQNKLYINNLETIYNTTQLEYRVVLKSRNISKRIIDTYNLNEGGAISKYGEYDLFLTQNQVLNLKSESQVLSVAEENVNDMHDNGLLFPFDSTINWNQAKYGPIIVPRKGKTLLLSKNNISVYKNLLCQYEGKKVEIIGNEIFINNNKTKLYTFKYNYYFVLDDNRNNAFDSRYWGFVPEQFIIGKANRVIFSVNPKQKGIYKIRWDRLFKKI